MLAYLFGKACHTHHPYHDMLVHCQVKSSRCAPVCPVLVLLLLPEPVCAAQVEEKWQQTVAQLME